MKRFSRKFGRNSHSANWDAGQLERRIMLDGDGIAAQDAGIAIVETQSTELRQEAVAESTSSLVFVDSRVLDAATLLSGIAEDAEVILLDAERSGIEQVTEVLSNRRGVTSLHFLTHGQAGEIQLGADVVNQSTLTQQSNEFRAWSSALATGADILLYGCDVAAGSVGNSFVQQLAKLTRADVAASVDKTGAIHNLADWDLEKVVGTVEAQLAFSLEARANFDEVLLVIDFESRALGNQGPSFSTNGYQFSDGGWQSSDLIVYGDDRGYSSQVLHPNSYSRTLTLDRVDETAFNLASFDFAAGRFSSTDATVTGYLTNGSTVSSNFASSTKSLSTLNLNWSDLDRVVIDFRGGSNEVFGALDNFNVSQGGNSGGDATFSFADATPSVQENGGTASIIVTRGGNTSTAVSVDIATSNGSAQANNDYVPNSTRLNFAAGETSKTFAVAVLDDTNVESTETFSVTLSSPSAGASISAATASVSILDNDDPTSSDVIDFEAFSGLVGTGPITDGLLTPGGYLFQDTNPSANGAIRVYGPDQGYNNTVLHSDNWGRTIRMSRNDGGNFDLQSFDYGVGIWNTPTDATVTGSFANGSTQTASFQTSTKTLNTLLLNWTGLQSVEIDFSGGATNAYGALDNFQTSSDGAPPSDFSFVGSSLRIGEGNRVINFEVTRTNADSVAFVDFTTVDGTAVSSQDYTFKSERLNFDIGVTSQTFFVALRDDVAREDDEQFTVELVAPSAGNTIANGVFTIEIADNDNVASDTTIDFEELQVGADSTILSQGFAFTDDGPGATGTVRIYGPEAGYTNNVLHSNDFGRIIHMQRVNALDFDLTSFDYSAGRWNALTDATVTGYFNDATTRSVSFTTSSKTPSTAILNWTGLREVEFNFAGGATSAYGALDNFVIGSGTQGTPGTITIPELISVDESQGVFNFTIERQNGTDGEVEVDYVIRNGSTNRGLDYTLFPFGATGTVTFADGQQSVVLPIEIVNDDVPEFTEVFTVSVSNPTFGATIANAVAEIEIIDDDPLTGVVYVEDFESPSGWTSNPFGTDTSEFGAWEQADPIGTSPTQRGDTTSGRQSLVTGNEPTDVFADPVFYGTVNGTASVASPEITLPQGMLELSFNYNVGNDPFAGSQDEFRVSILGENSSRVVLSYGDFPPIRRFPIWIESTDLTVAPNGLVDISDFAGQTVRILVEANSVSSTGRMEAGLDDVVIRTL